MILCETLRIKQGGGDETPEPARGVVFNVLSGYLLTQELKVEYQLQFHL